ncbi:helix-turn-helix domain-containing protein [Apilactobacillus timberlakei]|uniref:XRE family transcriptional regulator n=1 Tax=Apilactobacillus timberlakei TaxID=2008380 RepID=A0ABY2YRJ9_9LACO|nr:helix-turn-helix transcriptional regulator [Apilactobacillus timberlakei]TPR12303.1 XRE family transcriptional regulator [Apilactobacillus timberlakei]TPR12906.1 XRE family transcriptional regulator [Apilactobacillus timberlakei]
MSKIDEYIANRSKNDAEFAKGIQEQSKRSDIAVLVRGLRNDLGISQRDLAKRMGKPQSTIARIENGSINVSTNMLNEIARATNQKLTIKFVPNY